MGKNSIQKVNIGDDNREIAICVDEGKHMGAFWLGGFMSDMMGSKAECVANWALEKGYGNIRFDYSAHGLSSGSMKDGTISRWLEEAMFVFETYAKTPQIIIGSSMGGWLALLLAHHLKQHQKNFDLVKAVILIAPAVDMTKDLMWDEFSEQERALLEKDGLICEPSEYSDEPYIITKKLIDDGQQHLMLDRDLHFAVPIYILQGLQDPDVPFQHALKLTRCLPHDEVALTLINDGDHRLSRPQDLQKLISVLELIASDAS